MLFLCAVAAAALIGPLVQPFDPTEQDLDRSLVPPFSRSPSGSYHALGTDQLGRDIASRIMAGARVSLVVGLSSVLLSGLVGTAAGVLAGYYGGLLDTVIMRIVDLQLSLPVLLLAIIVAAVLGRGLGNLVIVLVVVSWVVYARLARSEVLVLREMEYVEAAHAVGATWHRILRRHILPNMVSSMIVIATVEVARVIIAEATLSFLGLGVPPEIPAWGTMLADGRSHMQTAWWLATWPGMAILLTVLSVNLVGDGLRDILDPRAAL